MRAKKIIAKLERREGMNRTHYFNYIEEKLGTLSYRINVRGKLNLLELNIHSETFFADLCNMLLNLQLINMNEFRQNVESIDLVDESNKVIVQVSATCTKQKIEDSLSKGSLVSYIGYRYKFIAISKDASTLRGISFNNPHNMLFDPTDDIIDNTSILRSISNKGIAKQKEIYELVKRELGLDIDIVKVDTNLAHIINVLAAEKLTENIESPEINAFEIDKKIEFNDLLTVKGTIDDYKIYYHKVDEKYSEFDKAGANKSFSVFQIIRKQYTKLVGENITSQEIFLGVSNNILDIIIKSKNYKEIPYEELEMCVDIIVVDAFVRCKIFKNPEGYHHVITR
jgi:hypothetical protein